MIYFVKSGDRIKIGFTTSIIGRLQFLRRDYGDIELLCVIEGDEKKETELHDMFPEHRIGKSDWFVINQPLLSFIDNIRDSPEELKESDWINIKYDAVFSMRMKPDLRARATAFAEADGRDLKSLIEVALEKHMRENKPLLNNGE